MSQPSPQALKRAREIPEVAWAYGFFKAASVKDGPINPDGLIQGVAQALDAHAKEAVEREREECAKVARNFKTELFCECEQFCNCADGKEFPSEIATAIRRREG